MLSIKNPKDLEVIKEVMNTGVKSDFWKLIVQELKEGKRNLQKKSDSDDFRKLPADQYKLESELLKAKIKYIDILIDTPKDLVSWAESPDNRQPNFDPYEK